jgi:molybdopterin converting factor small subunit
MAKAQFFGRLRDAAGCAERPLTLAARMPLSKVRELAAGGDAELLAALGEPGIRIAVNDAIAPHGADPLIAPGDIVAFLPPFSGG